LASPALAPLSLGSKRLKLLFELLSLLPGLGQNGFGPIMQGGMVQVSHVPVTAGLVGS